jgi:hypothetical protein
MPDNLNGMRLSLPPTALQRSGPLLSRSSSGLPVGELDASTFERSLCRRGLAKQPFCVHAQKFNPKSE